MNTIDDLRTTLAAHADQAGDPVAVRSGSVHQRIRQVRTRRRGSVAALAVVVAAVVGAAVIVLPGADLVAPAALPRQVSVHGFEYRLVDDVAGNGDGAGGGETDFPAGPHAVVVTGEGLGDGVVTVAVDGVPLVRIHGDGTSRAVPVEGSTNSVVSTWVSGAPEGQEHNVTVGIYDRTGAVPEGISDRGVIFREHIGERTMLAGVIAEEGRPEAKFEFEGDMDDIVIPMVCYADTGGWLHLEIDGRFVAGADCLGEDDYEHISEDAGAGGLSFPDGVDGIGPGRHEVRVFTSRDSKTREPESLSGALFGAAAYRQGSTSEPLPGLEEENVFEGYGIVWQNDVSDPIPAGTRTFTKEIVVGSEPMVASILLGPGPTTPVNMQVEAVQTDWEDQSSYRSNDPQSFGGGLSWLLLPGDTYKVTVSTADGTFSGALVTYRPAD